MRPKEYYDKFTVHEDARHIFMLMSSDFEKQYKKFIKEPIESIELESGKVSCISYPDLETGTSQIDEIWKNIQKAGIIIANITGFEPKVMLELGVALLKKSRVILIAEKSIDGKADLPINISSLKVKFYEPDKMAEFSNWLKNQVINWITPEEPKIKGSNVMSLMNDALDMRREKKYSTAYLLFENIDKKEPGNWYIYKEWGITFKEDKKYEDARKKLEQALEFAKRAKYKSEIYTELGVLFQENKMIDTALVAFEKAENLNRDNTDLYDKWAYLSHKMGNYQEAMNKMLCALRIDYNNKEYRWKLEYYVKRFSDRGFRKSLKVWLDEKRAEERGNIQKLGQPGNTINTRNLNKPSFTRNKPYNYERFKKRYRVQEELRGPIVRIDSRLGIFVRLDFNVIGLIHAGRKSSLPGNFDVNDRFDVGKEITVKYLYFDDDRNQIGLTIAD